MKNILLVFAREPKEGLVKTRLAKDIGDALAKELYEAFLKDIVNNVRDDGLYETRILCTPESDIKRLRALAGCNNIQRQRGDDLTARLGGAFKDSFDAGYDKVVAIGSDAPFVNKSAIRECIDRLDDYDCVIGPAYDGGYYLIGMNRYDIGIFTGIAWSSDRVFSQTLRRLKGLGYSYYVMSEMLDVDDLDALKKFTRLYNDLTEVDKKSTINIYNLYVKKYLEGEA